MLYIGEDGRVMRMFMIDVHEHHIPSLSYTSCYEDEIAMLRMTHVRTLLKTKSVHFCSIDEHQ